MSTINIYCDESCHLENDNSNIMAIGSLWCPEEKTKQFFQEIRDIKKEHNLKKDFEIKWIKVSPAKKDFYLDIVDFFFKTPSLRFRGVLIPNKKVLNHQKHNNTHDDFYYIMYYHMVKHFLDIKNKYNIYIDIKDSKSWEKTSRLKDFLNSYVRKKGYCVRDDIIQKIQLVRSHEIELVQITDLLIGAICYQNRNLSDNSGKVEITKKIIEQTHNSLKKTSLYGEQKFNLLVWKGEDV